MPQLFERPLVFFDLETTGTDTKNDRIVQYCFCKYVSESESETLEGLVNPGRPIPATATAVHGITDADVALARPFDDVAEEILSFLSGSDIATYNGNQYDVPLLYNEFTRAGVEWEYSGTSFVDVCNIFKIQEARTLAYAYQFYLDRVLEGAHDAATDVRATAEVFFAQLQRYGLPRDMQELDLFSNYGRRRADIGGCFSLDEEGEYVLNFGKHKGSRARACLSYISWMLGQDFPQDVKKICSQVLRPQPKTLF